MSYKFKVSSFKFTQSGAAHIGSLWHEVGDDREEHGLRTLDRHAYFSLLLFALFNPVVESMCGLYAATHLPLVRGIVGKERTVGLSRVSNAQQVGRLRSISHRHI